MSAPKGAGGGSWVVGSVVLSPKQEQMLRDVARDGGFDFLDPLDYLDSGSLWFRNRERVIEALRRKGFLDGDKVTEKGLAALAKAGGES